MPWSANTARAALSTRSRLRRASALSGFAVSTRVSMKVRIAPLVSGTQVPYLDQPKPELLFLLFPRRGSPVSPQSYPQDKKWLALALLALAQFVVVLDAAIVNVALPSIGSDLQFSQDDLSWVVNGYTLFFGGFLLLGGRMADLIGRRRVFVAGLILFALAPPAGGLPASSGI